MTQRESDESDWSDESDKEYIGGLRPDLSGLHRTLRQES
jgi:hypothetical protein